MHATAKVSAESNRRDFSSILSQLNQCQALMLIHWWLVTIPTAKAAQEERERHWGTLANKAFCCTRQDHVKGAANDSHLEDGKWATGATNATNITRATLAALKRNGNERQTAEEWNFETWMLPGSERWLAPGRSYTTWGTKSTSPGQLSWRENFGANIQWMVFLISVLFAKTAASPGTAQKFLMLFNPSLNA